MTSNHDSRGVARGGCTSCTCTMYRRPFGETNNKCTDCGHFPTSHAELHQHNQQQPFTQRGQAFENSATCAFPNCDRPRRREGTRTHDFCGRDHAQKAADMGLVPAPSTHGTGMKQGGYTTRPKTCMYTGCNKPCYVEAGGQEHDFCCRSHAQAYAEEAEQLRQKQEPGLLKRFGQGIGIVPTKGAGGATSQGKGSYNTGRSGRGHNHVSTSQPKSEFRGSREDAHRKANSIAGAEGQRSGYGGEAVCFYNREEPYYEFTNFAAYPVVIDDSQWPTTEHYFQAMKFKDRTIWDLTKIWTDGQIRAEIFDNPECMAALQQWKQIPSSFMRPGGIDAGQVWNLYSPAPIPELFRGISSPRSAFQLARKLDKLKRADWEDVKVDRVMRPALRAKFTQHSELRNLLLGTGTKLLVEHTTNDKFWGDGGGPGIGQNQLGLLLMLVRDELRGSSAFPGSEIPKSYAGRPTHGHHLLDEGLTTSEAERARDLSPSNARSQSHIEVTRAEQFAKPKLAALEQVHHNHQWGSSASAFPFQERSQLRPTDQVKQEPGARAFTELNSLAFIGNGTDNGCSQRDTTASSWKPVVSEHRPEVLPCATPVVQTSIPDQQRLLSGSFQQSPKLGTSSAVTSDGHASVQIHLAEASQHPSAQSTVVILTLPVTSAPSTQLGPVAADGHNKSTGECRPRQGVWAEQGRLIGPTAMELEPNIVPDVYSNP